MPEVLISIRPEWCEKIRSGEKTLEIRKTRPKIETPFRCYIYQTGEYIPAYVQSPYSGRRKPGRVIGEFICDDITDVSVYCSDPMCKFLTKYNFFGAAMTDKQVLDYLGNGTPGYGWNISELRIYDKPKKLTAFHRPCANSLFCESCAMWNNHPAPEFCGNAALQITRPPQSWCYVEVNE